MAVQVAVFCARALSLSLPFSFSLSTAFPDEQNLHYTVRASPDLQYCGVRLCVHVRTSSLAVPGAPSICSSEAREGAWDTCDMGAR